MKGELNVQVNESLSGENGIPNFENYQTILEGMLQFYTDLFGYDTMSKYSLFIDNGISFTGNKPSIIPAFDKVIFIKTTITDGDDVPDMLFQFTYLFAKCVFYSKLGLENATPYSTQWIHCVTMALCVLNQLSPESMTLYENDIYELYKLDAYQEAVDLGQAIEYDLVTMRDIMLEYIEHYDAV